MTSSCVRSPPPENNEHRLTQTQEPHYQRLLGSRLQKEGVMEAEDKRGLEEALSGEQQEDDQLKKPRRKDTPVLISPLIIPGVRLMKGEKRMIHVEDEEKDGKN